MRDTIVYSNVSEKERVLETVAITWESAFSTALASLTQATPSSSCIRVEKTSLQLVLKSFSTAACALELRYRTGLQGNVLLVCRTSDLTGLSELLDKTETNESGMPSPEPAQVCLQLLGLAANESNRLFSARYFLIASDDPELINPDGNTASLAPLFPSYEGVLCATFQVGLESGLDCHFYLLVDGQLMESLIKMLPDFHPDPSVRNDIKPENAARGREQRTPSAQVASRIDRASSRSGKIGPERSQGSWNIDLLLDVELPIAVSFGECEMPLRDVLKLAAGSVIELDKSVNDPVTVIVNQKPIAKGEVVMVDGNYGVRITEVESTADRIRSLG